jgi:hypothetical protein
MHINAVGEAITYIAQILIKSCLVNIDIITFDKFHILKIINAGVDKVRREEVKSLHIRCLINLLEGLTYSHSFKGF